MIEPLQIEGYILVSRVGSRQCGFQISWDVGGSLNPKELDLYRLCRLEILEIDYKV